MKKFFSILIAVVMICSVFTFTAFADTEANNNTNISLRIEGLSDCLFFSRISVSSDAELTIKDVLAYFDENSDDFTFEGMSDGYISAVNDLTQGRFDGYDGWLVRLNGSDIAAGISDVTVADGDSITLYYGDPFGVGMQYPEISYKDGILSVTSTDAVYDENFNASVAVNPVAEASVIIDETEYTTDENGQIEVDLSEGNHTISVEKYTNDGLPLVLRLEPDSVFNVVFTPDTTDTDALTDEITDTTASDTDIAEADTASDSESATDVAPDAPSTGDSTLIFATIVMLAVVAVPFTFRKSKIR